MKRMERFLLTYESVSTKNCYKAYLKKYFSVMYGKGLLEDQVEKYFAEKREYEDDVKLFFSTIIHRPPKVVVVAMSVVKTFLADNDVEFSSRFWKELRRKKKGNRALTLDRPPTIDELRTIATHLPLAGKTVVLMLASSGMRVGEALQLKLSDIELEKDPAIIRIRGEYTKTGNPRIAFISNEAKVHVLEWLKIRSNFVRKYGKAEDGRIFPFNYDNMTGMWNRALGKTNLDIKDSSTGWSIHHIHTLRKFFRTQMAMVISVDIAETLMGHEGYLTSAYRRYSEAQLAEFYKKGMHVVSISSVIKTDDEKVSYLVMENERIRAELNELKRANEVFLNMTNMSPEEFRGLRELASAYMKKKMLLLDEDPIPKLNEMQMI